MDRYQHSEEVISRSAEQHILLSQDEVYQLIYIDCQAAIKDYISRHGGTKQDIDDVLSDTFLIATANEKIAQIKKIFFKRAYLFTIARNLWIKEIMRRRTFMFWSQEWDRFSYNPDKESHYNIQKRNELYWNHFIRMGHECKKILRAFFNRTKPQEISDKMGVTVVNYYKKKSLCIKYLENKIKKDPKFQMLNQN